MGAATQFNAVVFIHDDHSNHIAIFFAKKGCSALQQGFFLGQFFDDYGMIFAYFSVHQLLHLHQLVGSHFAKMAKIETQAILIVEAAFLRHMLAQNCSQRGMQ